MFSVKLGDTTEVQATMKVGGVTQPLNGTTVTFYARQQVPNASSISTPCDVVDADRGVVQFIPPFTVAGFYDCEFVIIFDQGGPDEAIRTSPADGYEQADVWGALSLGAQPGEPLGPETDAELAARAVQPDDLVVGAITRDANGAATSAPVAWPDGATGTYTADVLSTAFPGAVDAYHITHIRAGITKTFTQPTVTRDSQTGAVTNRPAITVT